VSGRLWALGVSCWGVWACGCAGDNTLSGSVDALFPLAVSRVEVLRNEEALQVSYLQNHGAEVNLVVRVTVSLDGVTVKDGVKVGLQGEGPPGHARTTVIHLATGEPTRLFAPVHLGDLVIEHGGGAGEATRGHFSMSFEPGDDFGAGRTLTGTFAATAQDAGFGP